MKEKTYFGLQPAQIPKHIAIIMDGNGRWAKKRHLPRVLGHRQGMATLKEIVRSCSDEGVQVLTVYAFSTENWKRPVEEVNYLMDLLVEYMAKEIEELHQNQVQIRLSGRAEELPEKCQQAIRQALEKTKHNTGLILNLAMNYGGRDELIQAMQKIARKVENGEIQAENLTEEIIANQLYTAGLPDPDLMIRTAGDVRISNFLLWQLAYTELAFVDVSWPEFTAQHLAQIVRGYAQRDRRYGGLSGKGGALC